MDHEHMRSIIRRENEEMWHQGNSNAAQDSSHPHRVTHTQTFGDRQVHRREQTGSVGGQDHASRSPSS